MARADLNPKVRVWSTLYAFVSIVAISRWCNSIGDFLSLTSQRTDENVTNTYIYGNRVF